MHNNDKASFDAHGPMRMPEKWWVRLHDFMSVHIRYEVIALIFIVMTVNQADRATLSVTGSPMSTDLHWSYGRLGWMFSAFAWSYMLFQMAGGWAIDRFGAKRVYTFAIFAWSAFTALIGVMPALREPFTGIGIFALIFLVGAVAAPCFPASSKIVSAWFPSRERGTAAAIFNATQYFAAAVFTPLLAWLTVEAGWQSVYFAMGGIGMLAGVAFLIRMHSPLQHPMLREQELNLLKEGGATLAMDAVPRAGATHAAQSTGSAGVSAPTTRHALVTLLTTRAYLGIYVAQYCISALTFFFLTWFPVYLVQARHISLIHAGLASAIPAVCGFVGGLVGGALSDGLLRHGCSLTLARKLPIFVGMGLACTIVLCNYAHSTVLVVACMALAFFGKGMGALGWAVVSDTSPINATGLNAAVFNTFGSFAGVVTPIVVGFLVQRTHSFDAGLIFVGAHAILAAVIYGLVVGPIQRFKPI